MNEASEVGAKLKALRDRAGLSVRRAASALQMQPSSYAHYEARFKKSYLPMEFAQKVADLFSEHGVNPDEVMQLATRPNGFSEPAPTMDVLSRLDEPVSAAPKNSADDPVNTVKIAVVEDKIQIAATVDADGYDELLRKLELARQMID
ncbi:MAG: helix-turn-helix domain-containing protein [Pseudomonadota bacterium]